MALNTHLNKQSYKNIYNSRSNAQPKPSPSQDHASDDRPLMILRVEDKFGVVHILKFYPQDNPQTVAQTFGLTHGLDQTAVTNLSRNIQDSLQIIRQNALKTPNSNQSVSEPSHSSLSQAKNVSSSQRTSNHPDNLAESLRPRLTRLTSNDTTLSKQKRPIELDTDPANNGEKNYIVGKRKQETEK